MRRNCPGRARPSEARPSQARPSQAHRGQARRGQARRGQVHRGQVRAWSRAGNDITGVLPHKICGLGLGRSFQRTNIFPRLTVFENVQAAYLVHRGRGRDFWSRAETFYRAETEALLASIGLAGRERTVAGTLSYGNQKQLELGLALASDPAIGNVVTIAPMP